MLVSAFAAERVERESLQARVAELEAVLDLALTAIDEVESEPGAGTIFKIDWTRAMKAWRRKPGKWLAEHDQQARSELLEKAAALERYDVKGHNYDTTFGLVRDGCYLDRADVLALFK